MSSAKQTRDCIVAVAILFLCLALRPVGIAAAEPQPNVLLVMADDLGWGDTGYNGHPALKTPNLDAMAAAGLRFDRFYSAAPVCSPTRGSCLTGRHPFRYGIFSANVGHILPEENTLAEVLRQQGYATGHFGKWHLGTLTKTEKDSNRGGPKGAQHFALPAQHGFETYFSTEAKAPTWDPLLRPAGNRNNKWWDPVSGSDQAQPYGTAYWSDGKRVVDDLRGDDSKLIVDRAAAFIHEAVARQKPFFAVIWFHAPHLPVVAGPKYTQMYSEFDKHTQHYFGCIAALDEQVGRLRRELRELGVAENTILWFCSDNGPEGPNSDPGSTGGLRGRKRSLFEGGVRVPGLVEWPARVSAGSRTAMPASTSDYFPTVLDALGVTIPDPRPMDGVSLLPLLEGRMKSRPRPIAFQSGGQRSLVDNRFKIIRQSRKGKRGMKDYMLFDLTADPNETEDIAAQHPDVLREMAAILESWQASCKESLAGKDYR